MAAHVHAEIIKQWADGGEVEFFDDATDQWRSCPQPQFYPTDRYRIKPAASEQLYPLTRFSGTDLYKFLDDRGRLDSPYKEDLVAMANYVLKVACDAGQIVTREEFDRAVGDRKKRDMAVSKNLRDSLKFVFVNHDGLVWHRIDEDYLESILQRVK